MKVKTEDLTDAALDWAVAKCEKLNVWTDISGPKGNYVPVVDFDDDNCHILYTPCSNWGWAGPIIEREMLSLIPSYDEKVSYYAFNGKWLCSDFEENTEVEGKTPLIAAMLCYVTSKLGIEIEVPDELMERK
jgi:hypothetical protein